MRCVRRVYLVEGKRMAEKRANEEMWMWHCCPIVSPALVSGKMTFLSLPFFFFFSIQLPRYDVSLSLPNPSSTTHYFFY